MWFCFMQPPEVRKLLDRYPNAIQRTIDRTGFIAYSNSVITIKEKFKESFRGILMLTLKNRFNERTYRRWARQRFYGFGK